MAIASSPGVSVYCTSSSQIAVMVGELIRPDFLVINPVMPALSGVEAARRLSGTLGTKVVFVSELAKDSDFRDVLRSLNTSGCDCTAVLPTVQRQEFLAALESRDNGFSSDSTRSVGQGPRPPSSVSAAAAARRPYPEYDALLGFVSASMYARNAFRITGLRVDASFREISKQAERLEMMARLSGAAANAPAEGNSADSIRGALQSLKDPEQRLLHEMFWFWPTNQPHIDVALDEMSRGNVAAAERIWSETALGQAELTAVAAQLDGPCTASVRAQLAERKVALEHVTSICLHNLAVLYHSKAVANAHGSNSSIDGWRRSYQFWKKLHDQHRFWDVLVERIRATNDPRLTVDVAERIWTTLPLSLLTFSATLAIAAAESRQFDNAGQQRRVMNESGFATTVVREALTRKLKPLRDELARLCDNAEKEAVSSPESGDGIVKKLFENKTRYLQTFNFLLGAGDPLRDSAQDLVAEAARSILVAYANKTESWETALPLFEECLALTESKSLRARLEDDIEMLTGNAAAKRAARRTQATAAVPPRTTTQTNRSPVPQAAVPPPNRRPWIVIGAVVVFAIIVIVGASNSDENAATRGVTSQRNTSSSTNTAPAANIDLSAGIVPAQEAKQPAKQGGDVFDQAEKELNAHQASSVATYSEPRSALGSSVNSFEMSNLKSSIESNRSDLRRMEGDLSDLDTRITALNSEIESDKATLERMKRENDLGYDVDTSRYESIRRRHNNNVNEVNALVNEYNSALRRYKTLLNTTNEEIDRYNALVRSQ